MPALQDAEIFVGDVGTELVVAFVDETGAAVDVTGATKTIYFRKPAGTVVSKAGVDDGAAALGQARYTAEAGFFDAGGTWYVWAHADFGSSEFTTTAETFVVRTPPTWA